MQTLWMGVRPGPDRTRVLVQDGPIPILKARLPEAPRHPRALETLAEGVALWYGRPLYAALGVAAEDALCVARHDRPRHRPPAPAARRRQPRRPRRLR